MAQPAEAFPDHAVLRGKGQVTLPQGVRRKLGLREGDNLIVTIEDGRVVLTPVARIPRDQAWYWTEQWQGGEREVDREMAAGVPGRIFSNDQEFLAALQRGIDDPDTL